MKKESKKKKNQKTGDHIKTITITTIFVLLIILIIGSSYALFTVTYQSQKTNVVTAGVFEVVFQSKSNSIQLSNAYPMTESEGKSTTPFVFTVTNKGTVSSKYQINIIEDSTNTLDKGILKYTLKKNTGAESTPSFLTSLDLVSETVLAGNTTDTYELKIWLDQSATNEVMGKVWKGKIQVVAVESA